MAFHVSRFRGNFALNIPNNEFKQTLTLLVAVNKRVRENFWDTTEGILMITNIITPLYGKR